VTRSQESSEALRAHNDAAATRDTLRRVSLRIQAAADSAVTAANTATTIGAGWQWLADDLIATAKKLESLRARVRGAQP
jgi:hypothetical protein